MSWYTLLTLLALASLAGLLYLVTRYHRFSRIRALGQRHRLLAWLLSLALAALPVGAVALAVNLFTGVVVFLHLVLIWLLCDLVGALLKRITGRCPARYWVGAAALGLTLLWMGLGWCNAHFVRRTAYTVPTQKALSGPVRVVEIADSHLGIPMGAERFARQVDRIRAEEPDLVVIVGDFVDDDTSKAEMLTACEALGTLNPPCGVWFVFGNHDKGYYRYRDFTSRELRAALAENGVTVLEDEIGETDCGLTLIGRQDRSVGDRASARALTESLDPSRFLLMLDHQPNDYEAEAAAGVDLVLSGHTHGGHIWPAGLIGLALGSNDRVYGRERRGATDFIVTSGIAGWAIPIKTGTFSEYVVIDLTPAE